jgi:NAD(P)H-dependent flavin oxidoreductase YrpB (nitropropane dioxygenase family)
MIKTVICDLLGIKYPIIQASMGWIADAKLVAAVSNAGGLGTLGPNGGQKTITRDPGETAERMRKQIKLIRELTDKPFAVNFAIGMGKDRVYSDHCVRVGIEEKVPVAIVSEGNARVYTGQLHEAGIKVVHVVHTAAHAKSAAAGGVEAIITSGTEGGGHSGFEQLTTLAITPQVVDAVDKPVIAGGGITDGRGITAAMALGAEGVYMGTRFIATKECPVHENYKKAILEAIDTGTVSIAHGPGRAASKGRRTQVDGIREETGSPFPEERRGSVRMIYNAFVQEIYNLEATGAGIDAVQGLINSPWKGNADIHRYMAATIHGDIENGMVAAGQGVGLINSMPSCQQLIEQLIMEVELCINSLKVKTFCM